jgi:hypothetical protein
MWLAGILADASRRSVLVRKLCLVFSLLVPINPRLPASFFFLCCPPEIRAHRIVI